MTSGLRAPAPSRVHARLMELAARILATPLADVEPDTPFALLGLDSMSGIEFISQLEAEFGVELPASALIDYPTPTQLAGAVESRVLGGTMPSRHGANPDSRLRRMLADAELPADIVPPHAPAALRQRVLLTGATGFVGAYVLRELLETTRDTVVCLVRPNGADPLSRLRANLHRYGIWNDAYRARLHCVEGDLARPLLNLGAAHFERMAQSVDAVYHAAADVDWVQPYEGLRDANVLGTRELLRLACTAGAKPFHYLSSLAVCLSTRGPREISEHDDPLAQLAGLHLGYAQSKCVAEALVRAAHTRGLPITIVRPALVAGESVSGETNPADLVSRLMRGCVAMGAAPDLDWVMDSVTVDHAAAAFVLLGRAGAARHESDRIENRVFHLVNPVARHWRECVLWMRLRGYPMALVAHQEWLRRLRREATDAAHPLYPLRPFFLAKVSNDGCTLPELYEEHRRSRVRCERSRAALARVGATCPPIDMSLLGLYFDSYVRQGVLAPAPDAPAPVRRSGPTFEERIASRLTTAMRVRMGDQALQITGVDLAPMGGDSSIVAELTSWRRGTNTGLYRARITIARSDGGSDGLDLVIKSKPSDEETIDVGEQVARLCGLGDPYARWRGEIGFTRGHHRELAIYANADVRMRRHTPERIASWSDDARGEWVVALEHVVDARVLNASDRAWSDADILRALEGLAQIHAVWLGRETALAAQAWLPPTRSARSMSAMGDLWRAASEHARPYLFAWGGAPLVASQSSLVNDIERWWQPLETQPRTLVHNDFNPRNIMLRGTGDASRLCAYDWELATIGAPQRDLAEFLCFVLRAQAAPFVRGWLHRYRDLLQRASGIAIDPEHWEDGFRAALGDFGLDRIPMYVMVHRVRPQEFLPRVTATWLALRSSFGRAP